MPVAETVVLGTTGVTVFFSYGTYAIGHIYFASSPLTHVFQVFSSRVPVSDVATVEYDCDAQAFCAYCKASKVLAIIEEGEISSESGLARERAFERVLQRLQDEIVPMHAQLVPIFRRNLQCGFNLQATITTP